MYDRYHCRRRSTVPAILPDRKEGWMSLLYSSQRDSNMPVFIYIFHLTFFIYIKHNCFNHTGMQLIGGFIWLHSQLSSLFALALSLLWQDRIQQRQLFSVNYFQIVTQFNSCPLHFKIRWCMAAAIFFRWPLKILPGSDRDILFFLVTYILKYIHVPLPLTNSVDR